MMYSPGSPYIVVAPVVTSWAVAGQRMVFFHMFLQARVTLEAFPIVAPRGRSSKFPWRGTLHNRAWIWPGVHFISFEFNFSRIRRGLVFSWVCTNNACHVRLHLSCDFLRQFLLLPIICCSCFHGAIFFLLSNEWVLKCSEVQYFTQNILK